MRMKFFAAVAAGAAALAACEGSDELAQSNQASAGQAAKDAGAAGEHTGQVHSGSGDITEITRNGVTISHGPVESIGWPAMTMTFQASSADMLQGISVGDPVSFQFRQAQGASVLTSISKAQ